MDPGRRLFACGLRLVIFVVFELHLSTDTLAMGTSVKATVSGQLQQFVCVLFVMS